jgi:hypothetical protein
VVKHLPCHSKDVGSSPVGASGTVSEKIAKKEAKCSNFYETIFVLRSQKKKWLYFSKRIFFSGQKKKRLATFSIFLKLSYIF